MILSEESVRLELKETSEDRLKLLTLTIKNGFDMDSVHDQLKSFVKAYEGRLVIVIGFEGEDVEATRNTIINVAGRLLTSEADVVQKIKGCLVKPRSMSSNEKTLMTLFNTMYVSRRPFLVTCKENKQEAFVKKLVDREQEKRLKREK